MYFFMALGLCIRGFRKIIRPMIAIDGAFLKETCWGTLFVAVTEDRNEQIYLVAYGVADFENDVSWECILLKLWDVIRPIKDLVFISDQQNNIENGICMVFSYDNHSFHTYHIRNNVKSKYKMNSRRMDMFLQAYLNVAHAYKLNKFNEYMHNLKLMHSKAANYLENEVGFNRWTRHFLSRWYNMMTMNIVESMNSLLRHVRSLPIISLVECIMSLIQKWFYEHREFDCCKKWIFAGQGR